MTAPAPETVVMPAVTDVPTPAALAGWDVDQGQVPAPPPFLPQAADPAPAPADPPAPPTSSRKARRMAADQEQTDQPTGFVPGQLVTYRHPDPITGGVLHGAGIVLHVGEGDGAAVTVTPCSPELLEVLPGNLTAGRIGPADDSVDEA